MIKIHATLVSLCLLVICIPTSVAETHTPDSLPSYVELKTWELSKNIHQRITAIRHDFPEEYRSAYVSHYGDLLLGIRKALENGNLIFNEDLDTYLESILENLNAQLDTPIDDLFVIVSRNPTPNARSLGIGILEIYYGLFAALENTQQLAFILAHELAHEYLDHPRTKVDTSILIFNQADATKGMRKLSSPISATRNAGAELVKKSLYKSLQFSREVEREADSLAFRLLYRAGYDPGAAIPALTCIKYHLDVDSSFSSVIQNTFSALPITFDTNWLKAKTAVKISDHRDLSIHFNADSLKTHPDNSLRIAQVNAYLDSHAADNTQTYRREMVREDSIFKDINHKSKVFSLYYYMDFEAYVRGLQISLKWIHQNKQDSVAHASAAYYLMKILEAKVNHQFTLRFSHPGPFFPLDYNTLLSFCTNLTIREFAQVCLNFYTLHEKFISPGAYEKSTKILQFYLQPEEGEQSYKEWRASKKAMREN